MSRNNELTLAIGAGFLVWLWSPYGTPTRYRILASITQRMNANG